ncbi:MAG: hypothetical protein NTW87_19210 [Planctomycetota bacterium]|nr:hypothetical protein [Planctomycetota bacterium]
MAGGGRALVAACAGLALLLSGCRAQKAEVGAPAGDALEKTVEKGPVKMTVRLSPKEPRLSGLATLDLIVQAEPGVEIKPPPFGQAVGDFLMRDYSEKTAPGTGGKQTREFHYELEPVRSGKHLIRSVVIEFLDKRPNTESKGDWMTLESEPLEVAVTSELGGKKPDLSDLAPARGPLPLPPSPLWLAVLAVLAAALAVAGAVVWYRYRRQGVASRERPPSPEEIAHRQLRALVAENLHGQGQFKDFYVRLTGIVRRYIESTTGIRAPEETTEEFLRDMRSRRVFPEERSSQLVRFLEAADLVKYAAVQPGQRQVEESIARAQEFVGLPSALTPMQKTSDG